MASAYFWPWGNESSVWLCSYFLYFLFPVFHGFGRLALFFFFFLPGWRFQVRAWGWCLAFASRLPALLQGNIWHPESNWVQPSWALTPISYLSNPIFIPSWSQMLMLWLGREHCFVSTFMYWWIFIWVVPIKRILVAMNVPILPTFHLGLCPLALGSSVNSLSNLVQEPYVVFGDQCFPSTLVMDECSKFPMCSTTCIFFFVTVFFFC